MSDPKGKAETRQIFGDITDLGSILQITLYRYYSTLDIPEDVIHLNIK